MNQNQFEDRLKRIEKKYESLKPFEIMVWDEYKSVPKTLEGILEELKKISPVMSEVLLSDFFPSRSADVRRLDARKKKLKLEVEKNG